MAFAGKNHMAMLQSDGSVCAFGSNSYGQCDVPAAASKCVQVSAGGDFTVFLLANGTAMAVGCDSDRQCQIPSRPLRSGIEYLQVSAGINHTVLLCSDGQAFAYGNNRFGQCQIPELELGVRYTQVSAGFTHTVLLRSDGHAVACGECHVACTIPEPEEGVTYTQVSAGSFMTALLRSDGKAVVCAEEYDGEEACVLPDPEEGAFYTQVTAGASHVAALRSDGRVIAAGANLLGQCDIPDLQSDLHYIHVSAGSSVTGLLRSDGMISLAGDYDFALPLPKDGLRYTPGWTEFWCAMQGSIVLQLDASPVHDKQVELTCTGLSGLERARLVVGAYSTVATVHRSVALKLQLHQAALQVILPGGNLLQHQNPKTTLASLLGIEQAVAVQGCSSKARSRSPALRRRLRTKTSVRT